ITDDAHLGGDRGVPLDQPPDGGGEARGDASGGQESDGVDAHSDSQGRSMVSGGRSYGFTCGTSPCGFRALHLLPRTRSTLELLRSSLCSWAPSTCWASRLAARSPSGPKRMTATSFSRKLICGSFPVELILNSRSSSSWATSEAKPSFHVVL